MHACQVSRAWHKNDSHNCRVKLMHWSLKELFNEVDFIEFIFFSFLIACKLIKKSKVILTYKILLNILVTYHICKFGFISDQLNDTEMNGLLYDGKGTEGLMREPMWQSTKTMLHEFFSSTNKDLVTLLNDKRFTF